MGRREDESFFATRRDKFVPARRGANGINGLRLAGTLL